jgi:hypothetical protein
MPFGSQATFFRAVVEFLHGMLDVIFGDGHEVAVLWEMPSIESVGVFAHFTHPRGFELQDLDDGTDREFRLLGGFWVNTDWVTK